MDSFLIVLTSKFVNHQIVQESSYVGDIKFDLQNNTSVRWSVLVVHWCSSNVPVNPFENDKNMKCTDTKRVCCIHFIFFIFYFQMTLRRSNVLSILVKSTDYSSIKTDC